jgi:hypothetical protein
MTRRRLRHRNHGRTGKRNDDSLFGVLSEDDDGDNIMRIRNINRQTVLNFLRRNIKNTANLISQRTMKRHRSVSSESSSEKEADRNSKIIISRKKIA